MCFSTNNSHKKNGTTFYCEITSAVFKNDSDISKAITTITDITQKRYRMVGVMQAISKLKRLEEKFEEEMMLKKSQIAEAKQDARDLERSDIGKELHDNVSQLLGASKMYLDMGKKGGENSQMYLNRSSVYTLFAIEEIRKLTKGLITDIITNFGLSHAIENIARDTMEVNSIKITYAVKGFTENNVSAGRWDKFKLFNSLYPVVRLKLISSNDFVSWYDD